MKKVNFLFMLLFFCISTQIHCLERYSISMEEDFENPSNEVKKLEKCNPELFEVIRKRIENQQKKLFVESFKMASIKREIDTTNPIVIKMKRWKKEHPEVWESMIKNCLDQQQGKYYQYIVKCLLLLSKDDHDMRDLLTKVFSDQFRLLGNNKKNNYRKAIILINLIIQMRLWQYASEELWDCVDKGLPILHICSEIRKKELVEIIIKKLIKKYNETHKKEFSMAIVLLEAQLLYPQLYEIEDLHRRLEIAYKLLDPNVVLIGSYEDLSNARFVRKVKK